VYTGSLRPAPRNLTPATESHPPFVSSASPGRRNTMPIPAPIADFLKSKPYSSLTHRNRVHRTGRSRCHACARRFLGPRPSSAWRTTGPSWPCCRHTIGSTSNGCASWRSRDRPACIRASDIFREPLIRAGENRCDPAARSPVVGQTRVSGPGDCRGSPRSSSCRHRITRCGPHARTATAYGKRLRTPSRRLEFAISSGLLAPRALTAPLVGMAFMSARLDRARG